MTSSCRLPCSIALLALLQLACHQGEPTDARAAATRLCGLAVSDRQAVGFPSGQPETVEVTGATGSFHLDNPDPHRPVDCRFELRGHELEATSVFFQLGPAPGQVRPLGPGRLAIDYPLPAGGRGLVSIEPPVEAPADAYRFDWRGLELRLTGIAYLRPEAELPVLRSLGPTGRIELFNPTDRPIPVELLVTNTSDRLSRATDSGLEQARLRREGSLTLRWTGRLAAGARAELQLAASQLHRPWAFAFGGPGRSPLGTLLQLIEQARLKADPLFLLLAGDLTPDALPGQIEEFVRRTADLPFPVYALRGERDQRAQGLRHHARLFGPTTQALRFDRLLLVLLDSVEREPRAGRFHFGLGAGQLDWLATTLGSAAAEDLRIVALHAPPRPVPGLRQPTEQPVCLPPPEADRLEALARVHQVSLVLVGHPPGSARRVAGGTVYLTSGGGGAELDPAVEEPGIDVRTEAQLMLLRVGATHVDELRVDLPRPLRP